MYDLYRRRRAAPNYDEYNPEDWSGETLEPFAIPPADRPLVSRDVPDNFPVEAEASRASGPDAEAQVAATKAQLKSLVEDPDYWRHKKPDAVARVTRAFQAAYGGGGVDAAGKQIDDDPKPFNYAEFAPKKEKDEFGAKRSATNQATDYARNVIADSQTKRDNATLSPAARTGRKTDVHDLLYRPNEDNLKFHHGPYDPARDKGGVMRADWLEQENQNRPPWTDPSNPSQADYTAPRKPTHRDAERESEDALHTYERNLGRDRAKYPVVDLPDDGYNWRLNSPLLFNESKAKERTRSILENTPGRIVVRENAHDDGKPPFWEFHSDGRNAVLRYDSTIRREAARFGVDPDLVRAIMYVENARGRFYGSPAERLGIAKSILPMNIRYDVRAPLGFSKEDFFNPELNIRAGAMLIRRIQDRLESPTVAKIAQLYNNLSADEVRVEGARAAHAHRARAWERP